MRAIRRDVASNIDLILMVYGSISEYVHTQWCVGQTTAEDIEQWYWRTH